MKYEYRRFKGKDTFTFLKILKKTGLKDSLKRNLMSSMVNINKSNEEEVEQLGLKIIVDLLGDVIDNIDLVEDEVYNFFGDLVGLSPEEFAESDADDFFDVIMNVHKAEGFQGFFSKFKKLVMKDD